MVALRRLLAVLTQLAMVLPFVTVTSCGNDRTVSTFRLFDMLLTENWWVPTLSSAIALLFIVWPVARDAAVGDALRAVMAGVAVGATVLSLVIFSLFAGSSDLRSGFWITMTSWIGIWLACLARALPAARREAGQADRVLLGLVAGLPVLLGVELLADGDQDPLGTLLAVPLAGAFLVPVASLAVAITRRLSLGTASTWSRVVVTAGLGLAWLGLGGAGVELSVVFPLLGVVGAAAVFARGVRRR